MGSPAKSEPESSQSGAARDAGLLVFAFAAVALGVLGVVFATQTRGALTRFIDAPASPSSGGGTVVSGPPSYYAVVSSGGAVTPIYNTSDLVVANASPSSGTYAFTSSGRTLTGAVITASTSVITPEAGTASFASVSGLNYGGSGNFTVTCVTATILTNAFTAIDLPFSLSVTFPAS